MGTKTESQQLRAEKRRLRQGARVECRRADRSVVPGAAAQRLGVRVAKGGDGMRRAGITAAITRHEAQRWMADPQTVPEWLMPWRGERMGAAAEAEYRRQHAAEQQELRELVAEQSALAKVNADRRRFSDQDWVWVQDWAFRAAKDLVGGWGEFEVTEFDRQGVRAVGVAARHPPEAGTG